MANNNIRAQVIIGAKDNTTRGFRSVQKKLSKLDRLLARVQTTLLGFVGINIAVNLVRDLVGISDVAAELDAKMALVTTTLKDQTKAQEELRKISLDTGSSLEANTVLFTRLARPVRALGFELEETTKLTKLLAQGLRISGASQQESASVIRQMSQAFQSGVLRGEEFNALMENGGRIAIALSDGLGVSVGALRAMSKEGELTSQKVIVALNKQAEVIDRENARLPITIGRSLENIRTQFLAFLQTTKGANKEVADVINSVAQNMETIIGFGLQGLKLGILAITGLIIKTSIARAESFIQQKKDGIALVALEKQQITTARLKFEIEARSSLQKTKSALTEIRSTQQVLVAKQALLRTTITSAEVDLKAAGAIRVANIARAKSIKDDKLKIAALNRLSVAQKKEQVATTALSVAKKELTATELLLTKNLAAETVALTANSVAQVNNAKATSAAGLANLTASTRFQGFADKIGLATSASGDLALGFGKVVTKGKPLAGIFTRIIRFIPKLASGLLGLPGLFLLVVGSFLAGFVDMQIAGEAVRLAVQKITVTLAALATFIAKPYDLTPLIGLQNEYLALEDASSRAVDKLLSDRRRDTLGFKSEEEEKASIRLEAQRNQVVAISKLTEAETKRAELLKTNLVKEVELTTQIIAANSETLAHAQNRIELQLALEKSALAERITNASDLQSAITELEAKAASAQSKAVAQDTKQKLEIWNKFYVARALAAEGNAEQLALIEATYLEEVKKVLKAQEKAVVESLKRLIKKRDKYLNNAVKAEKKILKLQKESAKVLSDLLNDELEDRSELDQAISASVKLADIERSLGKIRHLDAVKDREEIQTLQAEAAAATLAIGVAEKERAKELKSNSIEEIDALTNRNDAATLYDKIVRESVKSSEAFALDQSRKAKSAQEEIDKQKESFEQIGKEIKTVDDSLLKGRSIQVKTDEAIKQIKTIDAEIKKLNQTIKVAVQRVDEQHTGGPVGAPVKRADGGYIPRSGKVPGHGSGDKTKALLERGEFIVRKSAVDSLGEGFLQSINRGVVPAEPIQRRFGGLVDKNPRRKIDELVKNLDTKREQRLNPFDSDTFSNSTQVLQQISQALQVRKWGPKLVDAARSLRGKDHPTFTAARNVIGELDQLIFTKETKNSISQITSLFSELESIISAGGAYEEPKVPKKIKEARKRVTKVKPLAIEPPKEEPRRSGGTAGPNSRSLNISVLNGVVSKAIAPVVQQATQATLQSLNRATVQSILPSRDTQQAQQGQSLKTIDVNINVNGSRAKGVFVDDDPTARMLKSLRDSGAVVT